MRVLITGGAGFIGSHTADALVDAGFDVRVFDNLDAQIHGSGKIWPEYMNKSVECVLGDIRDRAALRRALTDSDIVLHLASLTGVGQSMYQIGAYFDVNVQGTATLLDILGNESHHVQKLIVASSRAIYGEGAYRCQLCGIVTPDPRPSTQIDGKQWELTCPSCRSPVQTILTSESTPSKPASIYAITKLTQENMCLCFGKAYGMPVVALRYFNVFGPRQSFSNPYTGIITAFLTRLFNGKAPEIYEDGQMTRDFVHVSDVVQANLLAIEVAEAEGRAINVGTGVSTSVLTLAQTLCEMVSPDLEPKIVGVSRVGDIRHCNADLGLARSCLGYTPRVPLQVGLQGVIEDAKQQARLEDRSTDALRALVESGLLR